MKLVLPNPSGLEPAVDSAIDEILAPLQAWAGAVEAFGKWVDVPYSTEWFTSSAGTWTVGAGHVKVFQYAVIQDVMTLRLDIALSTTASMGNQLFVRMPDGWHCRDNRFLGLCQWNDDTGAGTYGIGTVLGATDSSGRRLNIVRDVLPSSTAWPNSTALFNLKFNIQIPVIRE